LRISELLIKWYHKNKRILPWRGTTNPYHIWLSEIMLQQTRVNQVIPYYNSFLENFPTIDDMAKAEEAKILSLWQGLGYYSRARNMHATAQYISRNLNGVFPSNYQDIRSLKGVGEYTAAAISSFAFGLPHPVLDGNVYRVIARLFGIKKPINSPAGKKEIQTVLNQIFNPKKPNDFNQAIMEFGSQICRPKLPLCSSCILNKDCFALNDNIVADLPVKTSKIKVLDLHHTYLAVLYKNKTYIEKRTSGIWQNLYQFPLIEEEISNQELLAQTSTILSNKRLEIVSQYSSIHKLSHRKIIANFYTIRVSQKPKFLKSDIFEIELSELSKKYPTSMLTSKYLMSIKSND
jgi:A/G-specific adenine glycosylase